jgi:hypothetical protein
MLLSARSEKALLFAGTVSDRGARIRTGDLQSPRLIQPNGEGSRLVA